MLKNSSTQCKSERKPKPKLPADKKLIFAQNINLTKVHDLTVHLAQINENIPSVNKENINDLCSKFFEIFKESADSCINENNNIMYKKGKKPWFGKQ